MSAPEEQHAALRDQARVLRRRWWIVAIAVAVTVTMAVVFSSREARVYAGSARVFVNPSADLTTGAAAAAADAQARFLATQAALAHTPAVAAAALQHSGTHQPPAQLLGATSVSADPSTNLLTISVEAPTAHQAVVLATAYARAFALQSAQSGTAGITRAVTRLAARIKVVNEQIAAAKAVHQPASALYAQLAGLVREQQRLQELLVVQPTTARVVQYPTSARLVQPQTRRNAALGLAVGLVLGVCIALLIEAFDTRVRNADEVADRLGLPLLARIAAPANRRAQTTIALIDRGSERTADGYHKLRLGLDFATVGRPARRLMVTSAAEGEGKSTTAVNLALAYAAAGRSVALVDLDVRRPAIARFFGLDQRGITDAVVGRVALRDATAEFAVLGTRESQVDGGRLCVVPAGSAPPSPTEFLASQALADVLAEITASVDIVVIDSPPMLPVSDSMVIAGLSDSALVVVRASVVRRPMLGELARLLGQTSVRRLGFALTDAQEENGYGSIYAGDYHGAGIAEVTLEQLSPQPQAARNGSGA